MGERTVGKEGKFTKDCEKALGDDGCVHYLDCGDDFMAVHICQFVETCKTVY